MITLMAKKILSVMLNGLMFLQSFDVRIIHNEDKDYLIITYTLLIYLVISALMVWPPG